MSTTTSNEPRHPKAVNYTVCVVIRNLKGKLEELNIHVSGVNMTDVINYISNDKDYIAMNILHFKSISIC